MNEKEYEKIAEMILEFERKAVNCGKELSETDLHLYEKHELLEAVEKSRDKLLKYIEQFVNKRKNK